MQDDFNSWQTDMNNQYDQSAARADTYPMKWHKFLIYFSLWAGGILNILSGMTYLTGTVYGEDASYIYRYFDSLKGLDMVFGIAMIALGVFQIVTRFHLARFKINGPSMLIISYVISVAAPLLYGFVCAGILDASLLEVINPTSFAGSIAMIFINKAYYDKRSALFVN